jgi:hypothetical protein
MDGAEQVDAPPAVEARQADDAPCDAGSVNARRT